jgi:hypothetical protein
MSRVRAPSLTLVKTQRFVDETQTGNKPTGQAYVNLGGKVVYLGKYGTEESKSQYSKVKAEWLDNRHSEKYSPAAERTNNCGNLLGISGPCGSLLCYQR